MDKNTGYFRRSLFEEGMLLTASDLTNLQTYGDNKRHIVNRGMLGHGVVYGLTVGSHSNRVKIEAGLALDRNGQEIYLPADISVPVYDLFSDLNPQEGIWSLCLEYAEEPCGEAFVLPDQKLREAVHNRMEEKFSLVAKPTRGEKDICVALIEIQKHRGMPQIVSVKSPVDAFCFSALWDHKVNSGMIRFELEKPLLAGEILRSGVIPHGFGGGSDVELSLSLIADNEEGRHSVITGDPLLFNAPIRMASKLNHDKGTFEAAVKTEKTVNGPIYIRWVAVQDRRGDLGQNIHTVRFPAVKDAVKTKIKLYPAACALYHGESLQFWIDPRDILLPFAYRVLEENGGTIDDNGLYIAPAHNGTFHVEAYFPNSSIQPVKAYIYVHGEGHENL